MGGRKVLLRKAAKLHWSTPLETLEVDKSEEQREENLKTIEVCEWALQW